MPLCIYLMAPLVNMASLDVWSCIPAFASLNSCLDRNWKWIAAVQHLHGEDQILNPELSSFPGKTEVQCEEVRSAVILCCPLFLLVIVVSSLQLNYFSILGYLILPERHFLWINKSGFQKCVFVSILIGLMPFWFLSLAICSHAVFMFKRFTEAPSFGQSRDKVIYLYLPSLIVY